MFRPAVALRSAEPALVDAVRSVVALADMPLTVHPPGAVPTDAALVLDSVTESTPGDPDWRRRGPGFAWVGLESAGDVGTPDGAACFVLPGAAEQVLTRLRSVCTTRRARVLGVVAARGGAGASAFAVVLARCCAAAGLSVGLVDLDFQHGGLDVLIGIEHEPGLRWADLREEPSGFAPAELSASLPVWRGVRVLSADLRSVGEPMPHQQVLAALADAHDVVVLDLPRVLATHDGLAGQWADTVLMVASCDVQAATGAQALARSLTGLDTRLVVRGPSPGGLEPADLAASCSLPLLATMPAERSLAAALERGVAPGESRRGPLVRTARAVIDDLELVS
ncbi:MAG: septum site-determining protein Ssd [Beutenbergiaceae bacterium]